MERPLRVLTESDAGPETFHDCHVHGLRWRRDRFTFALDLQYILEWIEPTEASSAGYHFRVADAQLVFRSARDPKVSIDWSRAALGAQISVLRVLQSRTTANGQVERLFEIELAEPEGTILLWSTGYEVLLFEEPVVSEVPRIPLSDRR